MKQGKEMKVARGSARASRRMGIPRKGTNARKLWDNPPKETEVEVDGNK